MTREELRNYFQEKGLTYDHINRKDIKYLRTLIIRQLKLERANNEKWFELKLTPFETKSFNKFGKLEYCYMYVDGSYFQRREAITFNKPDANGNTFIGFAGWSGDDNIKPLLIAFDMWVDWLSERLEEPDPELRKEKAKSKKLNSFQKNFSKGYFCACANMMSDHDQPTMVEDCLRANFMTIRQMKSIGVEQHDIEVLAPIIKEIERKRKL